MPQKPNQQEGRFIRCSCISQTSLVTPSPTLALASPGTSRVPECVKRRSIPACLRPNRRRASQRASELHKYGFHYFLTANVLFGRISRSLQAFSPDSCLKTA
ncbi:hypothetical protein NDU88_000372 [Pleurodeles waltl]|uniref:Uncharacterized protein n=1 Tax=Pleurodeles waltl TaxID=8319 RepID=A0AAV7U593_PLEWA|nr:hypothetical protein NDU88_000372 [Pleurodeles waltl]